jgi:hypothetical protein
MQSFFGKINFLRKFTPDFVETIKPLQKKIHKVFRSPNFRKNFLLYTFSSDQYLVAILTQKDDDNN